MDSRIKELFERYESNQASAEERKLVEDWFASFDKEQHQAILNETEMGGLFGPIDETIYQMLQDKKPKSWLNNHWLQLAAILLIATGLFLLQFYNNRKPATQILYTFIKAPKGTKKEFKLPDSTIVYLNSGSSIRIPSNFNIKSRAIALSGEAFFLVKHNAAKPFSIQSGKLLISDLGTSFNVKAYPDDKQIHVAVESGKVKVEKNNPNGRPETFASAMTQNQQLTYNEETNSHILNKVKISNSTAWMENKLRFDNASFDEISHMLERWYNVTVTLENNSNAYRHYTVSFNNEPITKVLRVLANLSGMSYQINKQSISINLKNCKKI